MTASSSLETVLTNGTLFGATLVLLIASVALFTVGAAVDLPHNVLKTLVALVAYVLSRTYLTVVNMNITANFVSLGVAILVWCTLKALDDVILLLGMIGLIGIISVEIGQDMTWNIVFVVSILVLLMFLWYYRTEITKIAEILFGGLVYAWIIDYCVVYFYSRGKHSMSDSVEFVRYRFACLHMTECRNHLAVVLGLTFGRALLVFGWWLWHYRLEERKQKVLEEIEKDSRPLEQQDQELEEEAATVVKQLQEEGQTYATPLPAQHASAVDEDEDEEDDGAEAS